MIWLSQVPVVPFLIALYLGLSGVRKGSLSPSGGIAAFLVGFTMMAVPLRTFGVSLIVFYLTGSKATKMGKELKAKLEEGHQAAGNRTWAQVLCNSLSAFVACSIWSAAFVPESLPSTLLAPWVSPIISYNSKEWCPVTPPASAQLSRTLLFVTLGHFGCCLGDTLASELGILSRSPPRLVTTFKPVPPGTNGGMSTMGTLASLAGGIIMGLSMSTSMLLESAACRREWPDVIVPFLLWGGVAGVFGSMVDSLMGATIQRTQFSTETKRILTDEAPKTVTLRDVQVISGIDVLTNNQVNLLSSIITAVSLGVIA